MDVIHQRVAGLDVHKETIVACVRIMVDARVSRECRTFDTTTAGLPPRCLVWVATASRGADLVFLGSAESRFSAPA
jgi:hypothetical protein